eukprot:403340168
MNKHHDYHSNQEPYYALKPKLISLERKYPAIMEIHLANSPPISKNNETRLTYENISGIYSANVTPRMSQDYSGTSELIGHSKLLSSRKVSQNHQKIRYFEAQNQSRLNYSTNRKDKLLSNMIYDQMKRKKAQQRDDQIDSNHDKVEFEDQFYPKQGIFPNKMSQVGVNNKSITVRLPRLNQRHSSLQRRESDVISVGEMILTNYDLFPKVINNGNSDQDQQNISNFQNEIISKDGTFWLNCVKLNKTLVSKILQQQYGNQEMKVKSERFYYLGYSLGKIIDLGNVINTVYTLLQLFEEYEVYTKQSGSQSLENNAILRQVLPFNVETFSKLQLTAEKRFLQSEEYRESLSNTDSNDARLLIGAGGLSQFQSQNLGSGNQASNFDDQQKGSPQQPGGIGGGLQRAVNHHEEIKVDLKYKSVLPVYEQHYNNYEEYIMKTSAAGSLYSSENSIASRIHATKVDLKTPNFKVLSCHSVPIQLDYCEVSSFLLDMLIIVYNKMYDNQFVNQQMLAHVEKIDSIIMNKVVKVLSDDINRVAKILAVKQLAKINKALKLDFLPGGQNGQYELSRTQKAICKISSYLVKLLEIRA